ncbi:hypothetical protein Anapl_14664 [Anas platyrhynchos]|uniref:Uncharacterized protein n=1 Tax=Anas platyrhynchos TaxID=8839 RepID=R0M8C4_ANAPL|nr:hypothetical protein Anapl_14664 [Anas platyrhynchos]
MSSNKGIELEEYKQHRVSKRKLVYSTNIVLNFSLKLINPNAELYSLRMHISTSKNKKEYGKDVRKIHLRQKSKQNEELVASSGCNADVVETLSNSGQINSTVFLQFSSFKHQLSASWTFHPALDLSPGTGTAQKDERKGSSRKGVEEGKGLEREAGGAAIELEEKFPSVSVKGLSRWPKGIVSLSLIGSQPAAYVPRLISLAAGGTGLAENATHDHSPTIRHRNTGMEPLVSLTTCYLAFHIVLVALIEST